MTSVGSVLRSARDQQGRTIAEVAEELCITQRYVRAIEEDDLQNLPGIFFYKSFVRQYTVFLGVEDPQIAASLAALTAAEVEPASQQSNKPVPLFPLDPIVEYTNRFYFSEHPLALSVAGLVVALAVCSGFYAWWSRAPQTTSPEPGIAVSAPVTATAAGSSQTVPVSQTASSNSDSSSLTSSLTTAETDDDGVEHVVLSLSATERTWLRITSDGRTIFSGILQPSESKVLTGSEMATMKVGNAAGIDVRLNGKPIGPLGQRGQVRTVRFTHENFEILPPAEVSSDSSPESKTL